MNYQFILNEVEDGVQTITLNRPEVYNALHDDITFELQDAFKQSYKDEKIRVLVLTGAGKAFCSGQDLKSTPKDRSYKEAVIKRYNPIVRAMQDLPKPIVCRLNGVAAGAGCSLALSCDLIIASQEAELIQAFVNIGLVPDSGSSWFVPHNVGQMRAFEWCTMGNKWSAVEAQQMGLVNRVVKPDELDKTVDAYVQYYKKGPTQAIGLIKKMLKKSATTSLRDMLEYEALCQDIAGHTHDHQEAIQAFVEKRKPSFKGK